MQIRAAGLDHAQRARVRTASGEQAPEQRRERLQGGDAVALDQRKQAVDVEALGRTIVQPVSAAEQSPLK